MVKWRNNFYVVNERGSSRQLSITIPSVYYEDWRGSVVTIRESGASLVIQRSGAN